MDIGKIKNIMKKVVIFGFFGTVLVAGNCTTAQAADSRQIEALDRGLVAVKTKNGIYLSWRLLGTEDYTTGFNVYRNGNKIAGPITDSTNYQDASGGENDTYTVRTVINGVEKTESDSAKVWEQNYLDVPIQKPADVDGAKYSANDATVADVDNDGKYEIILKWDPSNSQDNSKAGKTSNVYIDCYELDGTRRWRIDLGKNIRAGAHYTQFIVYDFNGDGYAEMAVKTADGTVAGDGTVIGDASKDYRNSSGYVLDGPEYLTLFEGRTGKVLNTIDYTPARGNVSSWGDKYGNRVDRFLAGVAYLDGKNPYLITCRGYYTRAVIVAYRYKGGKLNRQWTFDTNTSGNEAYAGQGNHNLTMADVDNDGKDEIVYGSCVIDDNGKGLYSTKMGHGDALHVGDFDPDHEGMEIFQVHEEKGSNIESVQMRDAKTGKTLWSKKTGTDVGRGIIANIGPDYYPYVVSCSAGNFDKNGNKLNLDLGKFGQNFLIWWDGDFYREGLDRTYINKYNWLTKGIDRLLTGENVHSNNTSKATPSLSGDIFGDWREEVIWPTADDTALRIYTTTTPTEHRLYTLMHDIQYRESIAWQNVAYNQPPHTSYYVGEDMKTPSKPNVWVAGKYREKTLSSDENPSQPNNPSGTEQPSQPSSTIKEGAVIEEGLYMIQNVKSGQYLEVANGTAKNGANVQQWGANGSAGHNTWKLASTTEGYYHLYSQVGDKEFLLDLDYGKKEDGTNIQIYQDTKSNAQEFKFVKNKDGSYKIVTRATSDASAIVVADDSSQSGANICQWACGQKESENWKLILVKEQEGSGSQDQKHTTHTASKVWKTNAQEHWNVCTECGETIEKAAHDMEWVVEKEATVTTEGRKYEKCKICGRKGKSEIIKKLTCSHKNTEVHKKKKPTNKNTGYSGDIYCKDCGKLIEIGHKIPKTVLAKGDVVEVYDKEQTLIYKVTNDDTEGKGCLKLIGTKKKQIATLTIPSTVEINAITYKVKSIENGAFRGNKTIKTVVIGENVTTIGDQAFEKCSKLTKVMIGKNMTTIGERAFYKDGQLNDIIFSSKKIKLIKKNAIRFISSKAVISVPNEKKKLYKKLLVKQTGYRSIMTIK